MARLKNDYDFLAGVYVNGTLFFNKYRLNLDLYTNTDTPQDQAIAFDRINYFIHEVVQNSVFVAETEMAVIEKYVAADIPILTVPTPGPFDQVMQAIIVTKLNAILEETVTITGSELNSVLGGLVTYVWSADDEEDDIHEIVNDEDEDYWWATAEPRFVTVVGSAEEETDQLLKLTWEKLNLHWFDEAEEKLEVALVIDPVEEEDPALDSETVIKMSDFKDK